MRRLVPLLFLATAAHAGDFPVTLTEKPYAVSGDTGLALYRSIGDKGPKTSLGTRAIALTRFELRWRRDYRPDGSACVLRSSLPMLAISTELPKPSGRLPAAQQAKWDRFIAGIRAHEAVHAGMIRELTASLAAELTGLRQESDPGCTAIRATVLERVKAAYAAHTARSKAFDKAEMGRGGAVEALVRGLVE